MFNSAPIVSPASAAIRSVASVNMTDSGTIAIAFVMKIARVAVLLLAVGAAGGAYYFSQMAKPAQAPDTPASPVSSAPVLTEVAL